MTTALAVAYDYAAAPKVSVPTCPVCGTANQSHQAFDRYGFLVGVSGCRCELHYLNPRLTAEGYAEFYRYAYRPLVLEFSRKHGKSSDDVAYDLGGRAVGRGRQIGRVLSTFGVRANSMLDVGGGAGAAASGVAEVLGIRDVCVMDPSAEELAQASARGLTTWRGLVETLPQPSRTWDLVTCLLTADHWLDPLVALRWIHSALAGDGRLWIDIVHAGQMRKHAPLVAWKVDHPLYWTPASFVRALRVTHWRVLKKWQGLDARGRPISHRLSFLCGKD